MTQPEGEVYGQEVWDTVAGIDLMRRFMDGHFSPPVFRLMGIRGVRLAEGEITISMPASGWLLNSLGVIYGGSLALLADAAITLATATVVPPATAFSPLDLKINYLRPVFPTDGELVAKARLVHRRAHDHRRSLRNRECRWKGGRDREWFRSHSAGPAVGSSGIRPG